MLYYGYTLIHLGDGIYIETNTFDHVVDVNLVVSIKFTQCAEFKVIQATKLCVYR
jgi:hypothetical protein